MQDPNILRETLTDLCEDVTLIRSYLRSLLEASEGLKAKELRCLWRLSDYLDQHVGEVEKLLQ